MASKAAVFDFLLDQQRIAATSLPGGQVYFYAAGSTTPKTVWLDRDKNTIAGNPYTLDSDGTAQIYGDGNYRVVIKDAAGVTRFDRDNINVVDYITSGQYQALDADYVSLNAAITAIGSTPTTLTIRTANYPTTAPVTIPSTLSIVTQYPGSIAQGANTITINGPFSAGLYTVFTGSGTVTGLKEALPEWFGAKVDGTTDDASAVNSAIKAVAPLSATSSAYIGDGGGLVKLSRGVWGVSNVYLKSGVSIEGENEFATRIQPLGSSGYVFDTNGLTGANAMVHAAVRNLTIGSSNFLSLDSGRPAQGAINFGSTIISELSHVRIYNVGKTGINLIGSADIAINDVHVLFTGDSSNPAIGMGLGSADVTNAIHINSLRVEQCTIGLKMWGDTSQVRNIDIVNSKFEVAPIQAGGVSQISFTGGILTNSSDTTAAFSLIAATTQTDGIKFIGTAFNSGTSGHGIAIDANTVGTAFKVKVVGCSFAALANVIKGNVIVMGSEFTGCTAPLVTAGAQAQVIGNTVNTINGTSVAFSIGTDSIFAENDIYGGASANIVSIGSNSKVTNNRIDTCNTAIDLGAAATCRVSGNHLFNATTGITGSAGYQDVNYITGAVDTAATPSGLSGAVKYQMKFDASTGVFSIYNGSAWKSVTLL